MRRLLHGDFDMAVRLVLAAPAGAEKARLKAVLAEADEAHRLHRATGRPHKRFGSGSLLSAAFRHPLAPLPMAVTPDYCRAVQIVAQCLAERLATASADQPRAQERHLGTVGS